jgi:hypothetical protein
MHSIRHHPASVGTQIRQFRRGATGHGTDQDAAHSVGTAHVADVESESLTVAASQEGTVPDRRFRAATMCVFAAGRVVQMILICVPPSASDDTALAEQNGGSAHLRPGADYAA